MQLEQLARTLGGDLRVIVVANDKRGIESALEFAERYGLQVVLAGARDARKVRELLAEKRIPVDTQNRHRELWECYKHRPVPAETTPVTATAKRNGG